MKRTKIRSQLILTLFIASTLLSGCAKKDSSKEIIAYVNKEPVYAAELKREVALRAKRDPSFKLTPDTEAEELDNIINRKLILQTAVAKGLAREDRFVDTMKAFWEQTLIRDFIDYKKREFKEYFFVTDDEIKDYYRNLSDRLSFKIVRSKSKKYIQDAYNEAVKNKDTQIIPWQAIGPVDYDEIGPGILLDAFKMSVGDVKILEDPPDYYLIMLANREKRELEPLEAMKPELEKRIIEMKERRLFEGWLKAEKTKANIKKF